MIDAYLSGNKEGAQRALDSRNAASGIGQPEGENNASQRVLAESAGLNETCQFVAQNFRDGMGPDGETLIPSGAGRVRKLRGRTLLTAPVAVQHVAGTIPTSLQLLTDEIEDEAREHHAGWATIRR